MDDLIAQYQHAARTWLDAARRELQETMQGPEPLHNTTEEATRTLLDELSRRMERTIHPETWANTGSWDFEPEHLFTLRAPSRLLGVSECPFYQLVWQRAQQLTPTCKVSKSDTPEDILKTMDSLDFDPITAKQARAYFEFMGLNRTQYAKRLGVSRGTTINWERSGIAGGPTAALLRMLFMQTKTEP